VSDVPFRVYERARVTLAGDNLAQASVEGEGKAA